MAEWPIMGRAGLEADAGRALVARGGVVLVGQPGVGKTTLAGAVAGAWSTGRDERVTWVRPVAELRKVPFGALALLLAEPSMPASPASSDLPEFSLAPVAGAFTERIGGGLLVVDDAHLLDEVSAGLIHQLIAVSGVPAVLTLRHGEAPPDAVTRLWRDGLVDRLDVGPLKAAELGALLTEALGGPVDEELLEQIQRRTLGVPLFVREMVRAAVDAGAVALADGQWRAVSPVPTPARLVDLVHARVAALPEPTVAAFDLVAIGEVLPLDVLEAASSPETVAALEAARLVVVEGERRPMVRVADPVLGEVRRAELGVSARRLSLRRLADLLESASVSVIDNARVLRWRLDGGVRLGGDALAEGARVAMAVGDVELALRCTSAAFEVDPTFASGLLHAQVLLRCERHADAAAVLDAIAALVATDDEAAALTLIRTQVLAYGQGQRVAAASVLEAARDAFDDGATSGQLDHVEALLRLYEGKPAEALAILRRDRAPQAFDDARIYGGVVEVASLLLSGRLAEGLKLTDDVHAAVRGAARVDPVGDLHMVTVGRLFARAEMGDLAGVAAEGTPAWAEWSLAGHRSPWCHWLAWVLGRAALVEGRARDAAQWFRRSEGTVLGTLPALLLGWVQDSRAYAELLAGDPAAAEALTAEGDREISMPADDGFGRPRAWVLAATGHGDRARADLSAQADDLAVRGMHVFESSLRHDLVRLGLADAVGAEHLEALRDRVDGDLAAARALHARAYRFDDPSGFAAAADAFSAMGAHLYAAEAAAQGATSARRRDERRSGALARLATRSLGLCQAAPTPALIEMNAHAHGDLAISLTRRERDIAVRAASGSPSKDIAADLGISRRTVDNTLQRVFQKLGVSSRTDLAASLSTESAPN